MINGPQKYVRYSGLRPEDFESAPQGDPYWWVFPLAWFITLSIGALVMTS